MKKLEVAEIVSQEVVRSDGLSENDVSSLIDTSKELTEEQMKAAHGGLTVYGDYYPPVNG